MLKLIAFTLLMLFTSQSAQAHFIVETQNREIHLLESERGYTRVILRFPMTLAYANELAARTPGADFTGPFMENVLVAGRNYYRIDNAAVFKNKGGFEQFLLRDFKFSSNGAELVPESVLFAIVDTHIEAKNSGPIQSGLTANLAMLERSAPEFPDHPYISDALVIMSFYFPTVSLTDPVTIKYNAAPFVVPQGKFFETRITDHRDGTPELLRFQGTGFEAATLSGNPASSFLHFAKQGVHHILMGYDHVLFVLCLVMAAASLRLLFWSVTGFTLGHSITLAAGVFGYVPQGAWFIPLIELLVAVSILIMGGLILLRRAGRQGFWLAGALGLLHGFGFAFMLADMLEGAGGALAAALAGFNIGVELGQLAIVIVAFVILRLVAMISVRLDTYLRNGVAVFACVVALWMITERAGILREVMSVSTESDRAALNINNPFLNVANVI